MKSQDGVVHASLGVLLRLTIPLAPLLSELSTEISKNSRAAILCRYFDYGLRPLLSMTLLQACLQLLIRIPGRVDIGGLLYLLRLRLKDFSLRIRRFAVDSCCIDKSNVFGLQGCCDAFCDMYKFLQ